MQPAWNPLTKPEPLNVDEIIRRGENARQLLASPTLKEAFADIERGLLQKWRLTAVEEHQRREQAWLYLNALDDVSKRLHTWLTEATLESDRIKRELERNKQSGRYFE
jgi:hypothetical protein